ncbi:MAG: tRNA 2-thiocytidine(32) synthetase TtcA [Holophagaceae bacterium]|nr:tRNA 2-thiocytidine(32) synthetase TtcA [Holophagaceae bacterium]
MLETKEKFINRHFSQIQRRLRRKLGTAIADYRLFEDGDNVLVALSGGKDSWALLDLLLNLSRHAPIRFTIRTATVDGGFPAFDPRPIIEKCAELGVPHIVLSAPIKPVLEAKPEYSPCAMCSRLRRGVLYSHMREIGVSKLALGHSLDDILETLLMNLFFEGRLSTMPLKYLSNDGAITVIRPIGTCDESDIIQYTNIRNYPIVPSGCPLGLCSAPTSKRHQMKKLISDLNADAPDLKRCMLRAMMNVKTSHLLDRDLLNLPKEWVK